MPYTVQKTKESKWGVFYDGTQINGDFDTEEDAERYVRELERRRKQQEAPDETETPPDRPRG